MKNEKEKQYECSECVHFYQHYRKSDGKFVEVMCGHCTERVSNKTKFPGANTICKRFEKRDPAVEEVKKRQTAKEYLEQISKKLSEIAILLSVTE